MKEFFGFVRPGSAGEEKPVPSSSGQVEKLSRRARFLRACERLPVDRPPIWLMRQAGRVLPEYRALKDKYSFLELAQTPELAAEATLQPIRRFGFDAAIIFSDILVIPEAMGVGYSFREGGGVRMDVAVRTEADIRRLDPNRVTEHLSYVSEAIRLVRENLRDSTALLGFFGSPWTLANFILEGGSSKEPKRALALFRENRGLFEELCERLTRALIEFARLQVRAGVDAIQIFDTLGGLLPGREFRAASAVWMREIIGTLRGRVPVIVFSKGTREWVDLMQTEAEVIGIDHCTSLRTARTALGPNFALQGNLSPDNLVHSTPAEMIVQVTTLLNEAAGHSGFIFNLGHGVLPASPLENIEAVVQTVRDFKPRAACCCPNQSARGAQDHFAA